MQVDSQTRLPFEGVPTLRSVRRQRSQKGPENQSHDEPGRGAVSHEMGNAIVICIDHPTLQSDGHRWAHLFDDERDVDLLHAFAARIGLKREWFQGHKLLSHYDVRASKIGLAIAAGARQVDWEFVVEVLRQQPQGG